MMLIGAFFLASASATGNEDIISNNIISEFNDSNSERTPLPDFGPQTFDNLRKDPNVLVTKGKMPRYSTQIERQKWLGKLDQCRIMLRDKIEPYAYPQGPVLAHGYGENGSIKIFLYKDMNVTDSQISEIYDVINEVGNKTNIQNIPVVFLKSDFIQDLAAAPGYDSSYHNPAIGAIQLTGETGDIGTLGFAAKKSDGTKGYVTVQHLGTYVGYQMYQPTKSLWNELGFVSKVGDTHADACFVPYNSVAAKIHIGNGKTIPVFTYASSEPDKSWVGLKVYKSGRTTGVTKGNIVGIIDIDNSLGKYSSLIKTNVSVQSGDSGGPLYTMPTSADKCNIIGTTKGTMSSYSLFSSVYGINYDLGVLPITT